MIKYTAIWQAKNPLERDWIQEVLGQYISTYVTDTKHEVVLDNAILLDAFICLHDPEYYKRFKGKNAFLVHFLDEFYEGPFEAYKNFRGVFRVYWSNVFNPTYVMKMPSGYSSGIPLNTGPLRRASDRLYLWSFVGQIAKSSRPDMVRSLVRAEPHFLCSTENIRGFAIHNQIDGLPRSFPASEYGSILLDSAFSPCPMGNANLETFRVFEALECGSIPVVEKRLTLDYYRELLGDHPIPTVRSWRSARKLITELLKHPDQIDALQQRCISWWVEYKQKYIEQAGEFLRKRSLDGQNEDRRLVSGIQRIPAWSAFELLRHHDYRALIRRIERQVARLARTGTFRVAYRL